MYSVTLEPSRRMLVLRLSGYWDEAMFDRFAGEYLAALTSLQQLGGCLSSLVEISDFPIQSQEVSGRFEALLGSVGPLAPERTAVVAPGTLSKMQARRAGQAYNQRFFDSEAAARAWLLSRPEDDA